TQTSPHDIPCSDHSNRSCFFATEWQPELPFPLSFLASLEISGPFRQAPQTQPFGTPRCLVLGHHSARERPVFRPVDSSEGQCRWSKAKIDQPAPKLRYDVVLHFWSGVTQDVQFPIEGGMRRSDLQAKQAVYVAGAARLRIRQKDLRRAIIQNHRSNL